jgi:hypothetical protein
MHLKFELYSILEHIIGAKYLAFIVVYHNSIEVPVKSPFVIDLKLAITVSKTYVLVEL